MPELTARLEALLGRTGLEEAVAVTQEKISTLDEFWPLARSFFEDPADDPAARDRFLAPESGAEALAVAREALAAVPSPWTTEGVEAALRGAVERSDMKAKAVFQPLRVALTGTTISPGIFETVALVGRDRALDAHRRRTRRPPPRLIDHSSDRAHAQRFVHVCR